MGQHTSASGFLVLNRASSCVLGWARWSSLAEATQIAHARTLPGWHSPAGRQAEHKVLLLSVPLWAVQPVSVVPSTHYAPHSLLVFHGYSCYLPLFLSLFYATWSFSYLLKDPSRLLLPRVPPASRASNKIPICQLGGGRDPSASFSFTFSLSSLSLRVSTCLALTTCNCDT